MPSSRAFSTPSVVNISDSDSDDAAAAAAALSRPVVDISDGDSDDAAPVALSRPVAHRVASSLHTQDEVVDALCKKHDVHGTTVDPRTNLADAKKLATAFASPPVPSQGIKGMYLSAANMKPERDGDTPSLSRTKRKHEEAASTKDGLCRSDRSTPQAAHGCSAADRGLGAPPGFHPKPPHSPVADTNDGDSAGWQAAKKALERITTPWRERAFAAAKPSDVVSSSYSAMLQAANYASFSLDYTLELKEKLAARDAEVAALREQLESAKADLTAAKLAAEAEVERARTTAVQQFLSSNEYKRRLAEHALAG